MSDTQKRRQALTTARAILLAAKRSGGKDLQGIWEYLRDELDTLEVTR